jgi:hypothetical protein
VQLLLLDIANNNIGPEGLFFSPSFFALLQSP